MEENERPIQKGVLGKLLELQLASEHILDPVDYYGKDGKDLICAVSAVNSLLEDLIKDAREVKKLLPKWANELIKSQKSEG